MQLTLCIFAGNALFHSFCWGNQSFRFLNFHPSNSYICTNYKMSCISVCMPLWGKSGAGSSFHTFWGGGSRRAGGMMCAPRVLFLDFVKAGKISVDGPGNDLRFKSPGLNRYLGGLRCTKSLAAPSTKTSNASPRAMKHAREQNGGSRPSASHPTSRHATAA